MHTDHFTLPGEGPMLSNPPKDLPQVIPAQMRRVNNLISRRVNYYSRQNGVEDVTAMHGWILAYLYNCRDREVFQRDIERAFSITRGWSSPTPEPRPISRSCAACARPTSISPASSPPKKTPSCSACSTNSGPAWSDFRPCLNFL